ncbi:GNAT family N-acetyltransferase [Microbacterium lacticum]|uniref:peptidogalycan biosysnthesis protein n=1 Tax=Microbacterium lacticum TaxID=33885 RepID=UPI0018B07DE1|nr:peptidogalycan biosysnthesis protein [Microbacterium lacticum]MBF9336460.1 GNAT family N-acetyltransferase [Microbacterium lacticum]
MIEQFESVLEFDSNMWDRLAYGADIALSHGWVKTSEATGDAETVYLTTEAGGRITAILPGTIATIDSPWLLTRTDSVLAQCAKEGDDDAKRISESLPPSATGGLLPGLVMGGRHAGRTGVIREASLSPSDLECLVSTAEDLARERELKSLAFLYVDARDTMLIDCLDERGYERWGSGSDSDLSLPGAGFETYLSQFPSRRRSKIRNDRKMVANSGLRVRVADLTDGTLRRAAELENMLFGKYGIENWSAERSFRGLEGARDNLNEPFMVIAETPSGEMIGFSLVAEFHDEWYAVRAGFDYDKQAGVPIYYEVVYYRLIELAGERGIKKIHYGMGSVEAKALRGCISTEQYGFLKVVE